MKVRASIWIQVDALGPTVITTYFRAMLVTGTVVMTITKVRASIRTQVDALYSRSAR